MGIVLDVKGAVFPLMDRIARLVDSKTSGRHNRSDKQPD